MLLSPHDTLNSTNRSCQVAKCGLTRSHIYPHTSTIPLDIAFFRELKHGRILMIRSASVECLISRFIADVGHFDYMWVKQHIQF